MGRFKRMKIGFIPKVVTSALVFMGYSVFFPRLFVVSSVWIALFAAVVLSILNVLVKPLLLVFSIPFLLLTFGLFTVVINAIILQLTSAIVGSGFHFSNFGSSVFLAVILTIVYWVVEDYYKRKKEA